MRKKDFITGWTIKVWWKNKKRAVCIDTSDMPDDVAEGIDDYLHRKYEVCEEMSKQDELL